MRWLIVGPYPPEQGSGAAAAAAMVAERLTAGDTVHTASPRPSAAHVHLPLDGVRSMWTLSRLARTERAEALWLRVEPGILLRPGGGRRRALLERIALSALLRRFDTSVLDVGDVGLLPGGRAGRPVFSAASRFVTHTAQAAATLVANGVLPAKVLLLDLGGADGHPSTVAPHERTPPVTYPDPTVLHELKGTRLSIEVAVRARAAQLVAARASAAEQG